MLIGVIAIVLIFASVGAYILPIVEDDGLESW